MPNPAVSLRLRWASLIGLLVATAAAFSGVLRNGWVRFDDDVYVFEHPVVSKGLSLSAILRFLHESHGANWVPLTAWSHLLDVQLYGLSPAGHHATSLLLHMFNAALLTLVLYRMTGAWWRSLLVAAFFALHPLRVESVAWIAERKDVLSTFFLLATIGAYAFWVERPSGRRFAAVAVAFACGLLSKPMIVTVPFLLVVLDVWPLRRLASHPADARGVAHRRSADAAPVRSLRQLVAEKWVLLVIALTDVVISLVVQKRGGGLRLNEWIPFWRRACNAAFSYWRYVELTLWPHDLAVFHPYPANSHPGWAVVAALALIAAIMGALALVRRASWFTTGWLWYVGMLVPVAGVLQTGHQAYADRFTYAPGIGLAIALIWSAAAAFERSRPVRIGGTIVAMVALVACGIATARQVTVWRDTQTLFDRVLVVAGDNPVGARVAHRKIGQALIEKGNVVEAMPHLERGFGFAPGTESDLRRRLAADADDIETRRALAATLVRETRVEEGIAEYRAILVRDSTDADACNNIAWIRATHPLAVHRDASEAVRFAERARDLCPEPIAVVFSTLAAAYAEAGRYPDAVAASTRAVELARSAGSQDEAKRYAEQLDSYRSRKPFHFAD